jgi:ABC-type sugar transport system ATPase subunit
MTTALEQEPRAGQDQSALEAAGLCVGYSGNPVVRELDLRVPTGEVVALLGANGAGKTTTLRGLAGELRPIKDAVLMYGSTVTPPLHRRARAGLAYISEGKSIISELSVTDNLRLGRGDIDIAFRASRSWTGCAAATSAPCPAASSRSSRTPAPCRGRPGSSSPTSCRWAWPRSSCSG